MQPLGVDTAVDHGSSTRPLEMVPGDLSGVKRQLVPEQLSSSQRQTLFSRATKRHRSNNGSGEGSSEKPRTLVVHCVQCGRGEVGHTRHRQSTLYFDPPQLYKGDSRASALRGQKQMRSLEDYLETHADVSLVVVRTYDCSAYHRAIRDEFVRLPRPNADPDVALELRPYFDVLQESGEPAIPHGESIQVSQSIRAAMNALVAREPALFTEWEASLVPPYLHIYHTRARMRSLAREVMDESRVAHLMQLLDYVEKSFGPEYSEADALFSKGLVTRHHMAKLFGPMEVVVTLDQGEPVGFVSLICPSPRGLSVSLRCYNWAFDGLFRKEEKSLEVRWPSEDDEPLPITALEVYPLRFDPTGKLEKALRDRGTMFWGCRKRNFVGYDAPGASFEIQVSNPRYMVDIATYRELHSKEHDRTPGLRDDLGEEAMGRDETPSGPFVMLLPPKILGFGLHDKKWRNLLVKYMRPVQWNKKAFQQLVLDPQKKELIEAMIRIHMTSDLSTDVIEDKGNGLIILLHGGPGTGKTLTAESVAELAEKPLYRVTCGDIGTDPEGVERYLESVLYIGSIWKAVVLLDESDIYLEEREKTDLQRNALVSVFLRVLEYYKGILILTSNRVGIFDEAFKSRVQLALHYPPLDEKGRWSIWNNFINLLKRQQDSQLVLGDGSDKLSDGERVNTEELRDKIDVLAKEKLNGRQIRNAITTARQLARFRNKPLGYIHLEQTIRIANEFEDYVEKTHGHTAGDYARAIGMRLE